jgi:hypothetical protein
MLVQRSQHAAVNDPERGTEPLYQPGNIDVAGAGPELPVVPEGFSGGVKLVKALEQARGVRRQLGQVQFAQHRGELLGERAKAVPVLLLEMRFQGLGSHSRIFAAELAAFRGLADGLLQRKFQSVPVVEGDRKEKAVIGPLLGFPGRENRLRRLPSLPETYAILLTRPILAQSSACSGWVAPDGPPSATTGPGHWRLPY